MVVISVLGPVEVRRGDVVVPVPGGKTAELLVRLALDAGVVVRTERLLDELWGEEVEARRNTLQSKVAKLRRAFGDWDVVDGVDGGYRLHVDPSEVDALAVLGHAAAVPRLLEAGDPGGAAALASSALELFQGDLLPAAADSDWARPHRVRLDEARVQLTEAQFAARLELGDVASVIGELEVAVVTYPYQERLWELLIRAQYRSGRQADALATYQRVRSVLADELGLEPGARLKRLEQQVLSHDPALDGPGAGGPAVDADADADVVALGNLPSMAPELVGREGDVAAVCDLVAAERLVEIVGPGGVGKTAVAVAVGRALAASGPFAGGVWLARLETAASADEVVDTLIAALDVGGEPALLERLRHAPSLVILDNCEHVVDVAVSLAERLLDAAPRLRILCTTQVPLGVEGEVTVDLQPLPLAAAVELFTRRADAQRVNRAADSDPSTRELCESLDGLPLAIELAAARTRTLSVAEIIRRLDDRFVVLSDPNSRRPERRRALRSTIQWSYDLLFPDDQRGLWALAVFSGGATLDAVEAVLAALDVPGSAAIDVVGRLASRSLVIVDADDPSRPTRFRLLDSIRAFAVDALDAAGLSERAGAAHARWFAEAAATSTAGVRSSAQAEHLAFARSERANIDAALGWAIPNDPSLALDLVNGFGWAWVVLGESRGTQRLLAALDAVGDEAAVADRANALLLAGWIEASTGHLERARAHIVQAGSLADAIGDVDLQARSAYYLAYVVSHNGAWQEAIELTTRSRTIYDGLDRPWDQVANGLFAARAAISAGDVEQSLVARDRVVHWLERVDDPWMHVRSEAMLGELARLQHRFDEAVVHIGRAAAMSGRLGFRQTEAYQTASLGRAQCQAGDYEAGAGTLEVAVARAEATGDVRMAALARVHLGRVLRAVGESDRARAELTSACAWHRAAGGGEQAALGECLLAALDAERGGAGAADRLVAILADARAAGAAHVEVFALDALARVAAESGDRVRAHDLLGQADRRMEVASHFISERDRTDARSARGLV